VLSRRGSYLAVVRFSRALGVPPPLPDALGVAIRVHDLHGAGRDQDLLFVTTGGGRLSRQAIVPGALGFFWHDFTTLLPYRVGPRLLNLGVASVSRRRSPHELERFAAQASGARFRLSAAPPARSWARLGEIAIGERLSDDATENTRFNPWTTAGGLRPAGPLMGLRDPAYRGSQSGRL
jgi:hypothetical protein